MTTPDPREALREEYNVAVANGLVGKARTMKRHLDALDRAALAQAAPPLVRDGEKVAINRFGEPEYEDAAPPSRALDVERLADAFTWFHLRLTKMCGESHLPDAAGYAVEYGLPVWKEVEAALDALAAAEAAPPPENDIHRWQEQNPSTWERPQAAPLDALREAAERVRGLDFGKMTSTQHYWVHGGPRDAVLAILDPDAALAATSREGE